MNTSSGSYVLVRRLAESDLGWFAACRDSGATRSNQRAINFNRAVVENVLPEAILSTESVEVQATCCFPGVADHTPRLLSKVHKNWRLQGPKVPGEQFANLKPGDFFIALLDVSSPEPLQLLWTVVAQYLDAEGHKAIDALCGAGLNGGMGAWSDQDQEYGQLVGHLGIGSDNQVVPPKSTPKPSKPKRVPAEAGAIPPIPHRKREAKAPTLQERIRQPHILFEMMKVSTQLSAPAQMKFLQVLETLAAELRAQLEDAGCIGRVDISHSRLWKSVANCPIGFVDGGVANLTSLGSAPIAIRVGSYVVVPSDPSSKRECFRIQKQLVDELYQPPAQGSGFYEDLFDDVGKLKDVARISLEAAGAIQTMECTPKPEYLFLHGALVNPVSMYALENFPNFSPKGLALLLPEKERNREGPDSNFVRVYSRQLQLLQECGAAVCGVVERASMSAIVTEALLARLHNEGRVDSAFVDEAMKTLREFRITDAVLYQCILSVGEYVGPVEIDRNDLRRAPESWKPDIEAYPKPMVAYVCPSDMSLPLRVEMFKKSPKSHHDIIDLMVHCCRLMPQYAFPAGLDIVDKYAKVPQWMSKPINSHLAVQMMRKAMETGNPMIVNEARRMLCGNARDWLFRPTFDSV